MVTRKIDVLLGLVLLAACDGEGELTVRIYGEEYVEAGIPSDVFVDGWAVTFDSFLVSVGEVGVAEAGADPALAESRFQIFDLAVDSNGAGHAVAVGTVPAGVYAATQYVIGPSSDAVAGNASPDDVSRMTREGFSVYVAGTAMRDNEVKSFAWGFAARTHYQACESTAMVDTGAPGTVQLTIHADHLFLDDLFSETPSVRFDRIAEADTDDDGVIARAELAAFDIRPLENYQVGSTGVTDLWNFVEHLTSSLGHIDGEGHCESERES